MKRRVGKRVRHTKKLRRSAPLRRPRCCVLLSAIALLTLGAIGRRKTPLPGNQPEVLSRLCLLRGHLGALEVQVLLLRHLEESPVEHVVEVGVQVDLLELRWLHEAAPAAQAERVVDVEVQALPWGRGRLRPDQRVARQVERLDEGEVDAREGLVQQLDAGHCEGRDKRKQAARCQ